MQGVNPKQSKLFKAAALEKNEEYKKFSRKNKIAFYLERTKLFEDDNQTTLTPTEKSAILYMNNRDVRKWYIESIAHIKDNVDSSLPLRQQAFDAYTKRNKIRQEARERMADFDTRATLDNKKPNHTNEDFDDFVLGKMKKYGLSRDETYHYLIDSASRSNDIVNKELRIKK